MLGKNTTVLKDVNHPYSQQFKVSLTSLFEDFHTISPFGGQNYVSVKWTDADPVVDLHRELNYK